MVRHLQKPFETITANVTSVKATHIQVLRSAVNSIREFHCMNPIVWGEEIISRRTTVEKWPIHIVELRDVIMIHLIVQILIWNINTILFLLRRFTRQLSK